MPITQGLGFLLCKICSKHRQLRLHKLPRKLNNVSQEFGNKVVKARGTIVIGDELFDRIKAYGWHHTIDFSKAQLAGINAARQTSVLFPSLGHNIELGTVGIKAVLDEKQKTVVITSMVKCSPNNDVNTEAMTAVAVAALTIYDMGKKLNQNLYIRDIELINSCEESENVVKIRDHDETPNNNRPCVGNL